MGKKCRILLFGDCVSNNGPANVNRSLVNAQGGRLDFINGNRGVLVYLQMLRKLLWNNVIVFSGMSTKYSYLIRVLKRIGKKTVYYMHGSVKYENQINGLNTDSTIIEAEQQILDNVDMIICVSETFRNWVDEYYPGLCHKLKYINSGVNAGIQAVVEKQKSKSGSIKNIVLTGSDRRQKCNLEVCEAVSKLIRIRGYKIAVHVYGRDYGEANKFLKYDFVQFHGKVDREQFYYALSRADLFVMNSAFEPFGLSLIEALVCGCSLLISSNVGAKSLLSFAEGDIVQNPYDIDEIARKLTGLLETPNYDRLIRSFDVQKNSWEHVVEQMCSLCNSIL